MALYIDEEDAWKCPKHPTKRRRTGICHVCLRERLSSLCPDCANVRPCACCASSSCSSSSAADLSASGTGSLGRVSNLIGGEPSFRRSRSLAIPFLRSKPAGEGDCSVHKESPKTAGSFWSRLKSSGGGSVIKRNDCGEERAEDEKRKTEEERRRMMRKSRSVAVTSQSGGIAEVKSTKGKGWYFPSPIKAFKQSISRAIMVQDRSPMYRG